MNITINRDMPIVRDFMLAIMYKHNNIDRAEVFAKGGHKTSERVKEALEYVWENLEADVPGLDLFFYYTKETRCFFFNYFELRLHEFGDINELLSDIFDMPADKLKVKLLKYYDEKEMDESFYEELIKDQTDLYKYITPMDLPLGCKWELYGFMLNPDDILKPLAEFCHRVKRKMKNVYKNNNEFIKNFNKELSVKIKNQPEQLFSKELKQVFKHDILTMNKDIVVTYAMIDEFVFYIYNDETTRYVMLGMEYEQVLRSNYSCDSAEVNDAFLKVFSDKHRMSIFRSLLRKEMYVGEIAKEHGMILSTTSYHLDLLLSAGTLSSRPHGKKVYYHVNKENVANRMRNIADLIEEGKY